MHYRNGRAVKVGDPVVGKVGSIPRAGIVIAVIPGCESCNLTIAPTDRIETCLTASNFLHLEDALPASKEPGQ